jgi:hypothetical protein
MTEEARQGHSIAAMDKLTTSAPHILQRIFMLNCHRMTLRGEIIGDLYRGGLWKKGICKMLAIFAYFRSSRMSLSLHLCYIAMMSHQWIA